jgi:rRNA pseudouridine-1189 N-methylase Emg1 (Nep1/Mra1 family)
MKKDMILIIGLLERHSRAIKDHLPELFKQYNIKLYDDEDGKKIKQLKVYSLRAKTIYAVIGKMGHNLEFVITALHRDKYHRINGGVSCLIERLKKDLTSIT